MKYFSIDGDISRTRNADIGGTTLICESYRSLNRSTPTPIEDNRPRHVDVHTVFSGKVLGSNFACSIEVHRHGISGCVDLLDAGLGVSPHRTGAGQLGVRRELPRRIGKTNA